MSLVGPRPVLTYEWEQFSDWQRPLCFQASIETQSFYLAKIGSISVKESGP